MQSRGLSATLSTMTPEPSHVDSASKTLGDNLRRLRTEAGLTQTEVASRAGIARPHYAALESGASSNGGPANPRLSTLIDLAKALGTTLSQLLSGVTP